MRAWLLIVAGCGGAATGESGPNAQVFVTFDATMLVQGSADDARTNTVTAPAAGTLSAYRAGAFDRETRNTSIVSALDQLTAPFRVDIVTTRPEVGNYDMIVIAGTQTEVGIGTGVGGLSTIDCANAVPNKVVVVFGNAFPDGFGADPMASFALAGLASSQGTPSSDLADDCLCWTGEHCANNTKLCTFGGPGTPIAASDPCAMGETTMDPMAQFARVYGLAQ